MVAIGCSAVLLTAVAEVSMVAFQIPTSASFRVKHVKQEAVVRPLWLVRVRIVSSDKAREILDESIAIVGVIPVHLVDSNRVFQPEKAMNVSCGAW